MGMTGHAPQLEAERGPSPRYAHAQKEKGVITKPGAFEHIFFPIRTGPTGRTAASLYNILLLVRGFRIPSTQDVTGGFLP